MITETHEQHYQRVRVKLRAAGFADAIHYAPDWQRRADKLYQELSVLGQWPVTVGLTANGRMAVVGQTVSLLEVAS